MIAQSQAIWSIQTTLEFLSATVLLCSGIATFVIVITCAVLQWQPYGILDASNIDIAFCLRSVFHIGTSSILRDPFKDSLHRLASVRIVGFLGDPLQCLHCPYVASVSHMLSYSHHYAPFNTYLVQLSFCKLSSVASAFELMYISPRLRLLVIAFWSGSNTNRIESTPFQQQSGFSLRLCHITIY